MSQMTMHVPGSFPSDIGGLASFNGESATGRTGFDGGMSPISDPIDLASSPKAKQFLLCVMLFGYTDTYRSLRNHQSRASVSFRTRKGFCGSDCGCDCCYFSIFSSMPFIGPDSRMEFRVGQPIL